MPYSSLSFSGPLFQYPHTPVEYTLTNPSHSTCLSHSFLHSVIPLTVPRFALEPSFHCIISEPPQDLPFVIV